MRRDMIKVKADGWRGWKNVHVSRFNPDQHEIYRESGGDDLSRAKALGIKGAHLMKPETLARKIADAEGET